MSNVLNFLTGGSPWLIQQDAFESILQIAQRENNLEAVLQQRGKPLDNTRSIIMRDGVAIMSVNGPLFPRANLFNEISGATSVQMLALDLEEAKHNDQVRSVILNFDTPGGHVTMINEYSQMIKDFPKPIWGYVTGQAASGGYWMLSACDKVIVDATATLGSIGVVAGYGKNKGDQIEIVSSNAPNKRPNIESDEGRAVVQAYIDDVEAVFIEKVMNYRGMSREQVIGLRGGVVIGAKAVEAGFADEVGSLEGCILKLKEENLMDLETLRADHPEVYQAAVDQGKQEASSNQDKLVAEAGSSAVTAERQRITAILSCDSAKGRMQLAQHIAFDTDMTADSAEKMLAAAPLAAKASGFEQMSAQMQAENPDIGADADDADEDDMSTSLKQFEALEV